MLWLLTVLMLNATASVPDSLALLSLPPLPYIEQPVADPPIKDFYRYRVVYRWRGQRCIRWRTDYVMSTVVKAGNDTLGANMTNSQLADLIARTDLPDTAEVSMTQWVARYEQRRNGVITRLYYVYDFDEDRLRQLDERWNRSSASHIPFRPSPK